MPVDDHDQPTDGETRLPALGERGAESPGERPAESATGVFCRRCGETSAPIAGACPWCGVRLAGPRPKGVPVYELDSEPEDDWHAQVREEDYAPPAARPHMTQPVVVVAVSYFLLFVSLLLFAILAGVYTGGKMEDMYDWMAVVQLLDGLLTVGALALVWKASKQTVPRGGTKRLTWIVAFPALAVLLCINIAYLTLLRELLRPLGVPEAPKFQLTYLSVLVICVLPAIVEELFFRQMVLGVFRHVMHLHVAVWVTAAMFSAIHLGNILGMPYLLLAGAAFGYARVYGGLPLAMILHFLHNLAVIAYDSMR